MPGMSAPMGMPAGCCIAPACAMASAALCLACLALSKSPIALSPALWGTKTGTVRRGRDCFNQRSCVSSPKVTRSTFAVDESVDQSTQRAAHVGLEAVGAVERVARLDRVVAGDT